MEKQIPILSEHENAQSLSSAPQGYTPTDEEKKTIKLVTRLFEKAKRHRKKYDEKWLDYYKMFRGKQWKEQRPTYRHSEVINFIFQAIQGVVPIMTDSRPKIEFLPQEPQDMELSEILNEVSASDWERSNWLMKLTENIYDAHFYGTAFGAMEFDPKGRMSAGAVVFSSKDPFYSFPDPNARDLTKDPEDRCKYFIYAEPIDIEILKREYPEKKDFIKGDLIDLIQGEKTDLDQVRFKSPVDTKTIVEGTSAYEAQARDQALKITCYLFSDEEIEEEIKEQMPDGSEVIQGYAQKLKYPNGRKTCLASGVLLSDGPIEYDDGEIPYAKLVNYILPREFWGMSEVEQLESPQKIFNKLVSFALDVLTLMGNPIWVVDTSSGVDTDNLFNRPGLIVEKEPGSEVRREEGVQLQPYVLQLIDRMANWFDGISGANDVTRGVRPEGVTAASAINSLQEAAQTRIRQKSRNLDAYLQRLGQLYKNRVFQFYTSPQIIRLTNNQNAQKYFKFHIDQIPNEDGTISKVAKVRDFIPDSSGRLVESLETKEYLVKGDFDVRVTMGSSLPFAKTEKINLAKMLFEAGAIDEPELLKAADYPNWEAVWARVEARKAQMMQQDAMMKGGGVPTDLVPAGAPSPEQASMPT